MQRFIIGTFVIAALTMIGGFVYPADTKCSVNVEYIDLLEAPTAVTINFPAVGGSPEVTMNTDLLKYSHNSTISKRITATVVSDSVFDTNITLKASLDGESSVTFIESGKPLSNVTIWDNITAGGYTKKIDWSVQSHGRKVSRPALSYTIVFTSSDIS